MFLKNDVIHRFGVLKYIMMDNGFEWSMKFDQLCKIYGIIHQYITPQWFRCNGIVEWLVKVLKHGLNVLSITFVATPLWPSVGVNPNTPKVGDLESSETSKCLGFDSKAQNTSH